VTWKTLELRARRPDAFDGAYEPVDLGPGVCAFVRGADVFAVVPVREVAPPNPGGEWRDVFGAALGVGLFERS
jgi:(1->4)-alpha-D-glucan 1-alpha-D-glucosylmutase